MCFHLWAVALAVPFASGGLALAVNMVNSLPHSGQGLTVLSEDSSHLHSAKLVPFPPSVLHFSLFALSPFDTVCFSR